MSTAQPTNREARRMFRLKDLETWAKANIRPEDDEEAATRQIAAEAIKRFEVSTYAARDYAGIIYWRLRRNGGK